MVAKLTPEIIHSKKEGFRLRNIEMLSEFTGAQDKHNFRCLIDNHVWSTTFSSVCSGRGCAKCRSATVSKAKTIKPDRIENIKVKLLSRNIELISPYSGSKNRHNFKCLTIGCGYVWNTTFDSVCNQNTGCSKCLGLKKKTIEEVRERFTARGFTLLSTEYKNCGSSLNYICGKGHQTKISFDSLQSGIGCVECGGTKKKTIEEVREFFTARGYTLVSKEYKNSGTALLYICNKGHQTKISFDNLKSGKGCASCQESGFNPNKSATLYYIRFQYEGNFYYKIGITNKTTSKRFQSEKTSYTIIKETFYTLGKDAHTQEQAILKKFSASRYKGKPFLTTNGNTELFIKDVLQIDYEPFQNFAA